MIRVAIFISGGGSNMVRLVDSMTGDHPARPVLVAADRRDAGGLAKARARGVATWAPEGRMSKPKLETALHRAATGAQADVICLAGYMKILSAEFVTGWQGQMLNIHPSLLPKYKGLNTHARAIAAGEAIHGCTVHEVTVDLDNGPIWGQSEVPVLVGDTPDTLARRVLAAEHQLYPRVLRDFVAALG